MLILALVLLGGAILYASTGQLGKIVASFGSTIGGLITKVSETATPTASPIPRVDSPVLIRADEEYTNQPTVDLQGTLPAEVAGRSDYKVRIYRSLGNENSPAELVGELGIGAAELAQLVKADLESWRATVKASGFKPMD